MEKQNFFPPFLGQRTRAMIFVDGENLAIRYKEMLGSQDSQEHVTHIPDVAVWTPWANAGRHPNCEVIRRHYYTSCCGDDQRRDEVCNTLKQVGIQQPRVFKRTRDGRSKMVDITLTTEMLMHAHNGNFDIAVLVTGDGDFVPLVEAVVNMGKRVVLWALESGLSKRLERSVDHCFDVGVPLFQPEDVLLRWGFLST